MRESSLPGWWLLDDGAAATLVAFASVDDHRRQAELAAQRWLASHGLGLLPCPDDPPLDPAARAQLSAALGGDVTTAWFEAPAGWPADAPENQVQGTTLLDGLGRALRTLHALTPPEHVHAVDTAALVRRAAERVDAGAVDPARFDRSRQGLDPRRLLQQLEQWQPLLLDRRPVPPTLTHGALRLGAVWVERGRPTALLGAAGLAVSDPYRDLAAMARSLAALFGPEALPGFFAAYGLSDPDPIRLEFHALLDELL